MAFVIPRKREYWGRDIQNRPYEINWSNPHSKGLAVAVVAGREIAAGFDWTADTTSIDGIDLKALDNTVNAYIQEPLLKTANGSGTGDFSLFINARLTAADGTVSNLVGNKNDAAGSPFSQGFIGAHMNSGGGYSVDEIGFFTFSGGTSSTTIASAVDTTIYQDICSTRAGSLMSLYVDDQTSTASPTVRNITGSDPRFIMGHSGKATNEDAGDFLSPISLAWDRALSQDEYNDLRVNPYQVLKPQRKYWVLPSEGVVTTSPSNPLRGPISMRGPI